jgi:hypothetical protein
MEGHPARRLAAALGKAVAVVCALAPLVGCGGWVTGVVAHEAREAMSPPRPRLDDELDFWPGLGDVLHWGEVGFCTGAGGTILVWLTCCCVWKRRANAVFTVLLLAGLLAVWLQYDLNRYDSKTLHLLEAHFGAKVSRRE